MGMRQVMARSLQDLDIDFSNGPKILKEWGQGAVLAQFPPHHFRKSPPTVVRLHAVETGILIAFPIFDPAHAHCLARYLLVRIGCATVHRSRWESRRRAIDLTAHIQQRMSVFVCAALQLHIRIADLVRYSGRSSDASRCISSSGLLV